MPLPAPLPRSASTSRKRKTFAATLHDLRHGKHHADRTRAQEIAIAYRQSGQSRRRRRK
jgi:hypothetical protein